MCLTRRSKLWTHSINSHFGLREAVRELLNHQAQAEKRYREFIGADG